MLESADSLSPIESEVESVAPSMSADNDRDSLVLINTSEAGSLQNTTVLSLSKITMLDSADVVVSKSNVCP